MLYESDGLDPAHWPESYWRASYTQAVPEFVPLSGNDHADVVVIGAGYAGLNAALELVERFGARVIVLDSAQPGWGASGRNGGFCCLGGARLDEKAMRRRFGAQALLDWQDFEMAGITRVQDNLQRYDIDASPTESGELKLTESSRRWKQMRKAHHPAGTQFWDQAALVAQGLNTATYHGGCMTPAGFGLNPYAYVLGLAKAACTAGVILHGNSAAHRLEPASGGWRVHCQSGSITARKVLVATNGYTDERLIPWVRGRLLPVISNILVTRPLTSAELQNQGWTRQIMAYDDRIMLHYFRLLPDKRMLFGTRGGLSFSAGPYRSFLARARVEFDTIFPHLAQARTAFHWNGLVCLTGSMTPFIGAVPQADGLWMALGWHGNGVAAASEGGRRVASAMMGGANASAADTRPIVTRHAPARFPLPRKPLLRAAMTLAGIADGRMRRRD